jgi:hypothetical protein
MEASRGTAFDEPPPDGCKDYNDYLCDRLGLPGRKQGTGALKDESSLSDGYLILCLNG